MSTVIDHAISIPARPTLVWEQISDLSNNPIWQADTESVAFLSTKHSGKGTRWRARTSDGSEQVIEITAWYDGLGYEYMIVDGSDLENNRGRIRLQEVPEGTVVQWTFNYEISGMFSGLRNSLMTKRRIDSDVVDSLRNLYNYLKEVKQADFTVEESKSLMREAPDVEERSKYQPRHPSVERKTASVVPDNQDDIFKPPAATTDPISENTAPAIPEPALDDDDTRPNPAVTDSDQLAQPVPDDIGEDAPAVNQSTTDDIPTADKPQRQTFDEPEFVDNLPDWARPKEQQEPAADVSSTDDEDNIAVDSPAANIPPAADSDDTIEHVADDERPSSTPETAPAPETPTPEPVSTTQPERQIEDGTDDSDISESAPPEPPSAMPDVNKLDTAQVSVFEIFGLEKPSETERMRAITDETENDASAESSPPSTESVSTDADEVRQTETQEAQVSEADVESVAPASKDQQVPFDTGEVIVPDVDPEAPSSRTGLRAKLRRSLARIRRP